MAVGDVTTVVDQTAFVFELMASTTAATVAPTLSTDGLSLNDVRGRIGTVPEFLRCAVKSTAGSGVMTVTVQVWLRLGALGWVVARPFNAASTAPQTPVAIAETSTDSIAYSEVVDIPGSADRIYMQVTAIAGTATAVTGYALASR